MKIIAHRGAGAGIRASEPENTVRALKRAFARDCGADAAEIDVRLTRDHRVVVIHDETLERTTNGTGRVCDKTLEELRLLDAGKGERIPELSDALMVARKYSRSLIIELKDRDMEWQVLEEVIEAGMEEKVTFSSFFHTSIRNLKQTLIESGRGEIKIKTGVIIASLPVNPVQLVHDARADIIFPKYTRLTPEFVLQCARGGIEVYPWTVNSAEDFDKAISYGVDGVVTDYPCELVEMRNRRGSGA